MIPAKPAAVLVLGSINVDSTSYVERFPTPGETVTGTGFRMALGGKGANQAVAAHRAGAAVQLVGAVGADSAGDFAIGELSRLGLATDAVGRMPDAATGVAQITVAADGENTVIVTPGANAAIDASAARPGTPVGIAVSQGEVPAAAITALAEASAASGTPFLLNLAPPVALPAATIAVCDPLVVNELEAAAIGIRAERPGSDDPVESWVDAARAAVASGTCRSIVITLGAAGAVAADASDSRHTAAPRVTPVDTTGAGDCFVGTLAAGLADGRDLHSAVGLAVAAATLSVLERGTVDSYADRAGILAFAAQNGLA